VTLHGFDQYVRLSMHLVISVSIFKEQIQTAALLQECLLLRDGLVHLPDVFTVSDMHVFIRYLCTC